MPGQQNEHPQLVQVMEIQLSWLRVHSTLRSLLVGTCTWLTHVVRQRAGQASALEGNSAVECITGRSLTGQMYPLSHAQHSSPACPSAVPSSWQTHITVCHQGAAR